MPNFPPNVYYRDTYGFDDRPSESDNDSITTKSTGLLFLERNLSKATKIC